MATTKITKNTEVNIINNTIGGLFFRNNRTLETWDITEPFGVDTITVGDIAAIKASEPLIFTEGWAYIDNEEAVKFLRLENVYEKLIHPFKIDEFLELPEEEIAKKLRGINKNTRCVLISKIHEKIQNGTFDSIKKQRVIEGALGIKFDEI